MHALSPDPCSTFEGRSNHLKQCIVRNSGVHSINLSPPSSTLKFENYGKQFKAPFVIYADFECTPEKTDDPSRPQQHKLSGYAFKTVCCHDSNTIVDKPIIGGETITTSPLCVAL